MTTVKEAIEAYEYAVLQLSPNTQSWYSQKLKVFCQWADENSITLETLKVVHLRQFTEYLKTRKNQVGKPLSTYTQHGYTQVVKSFLNWCSKEDDLEDIVSAKLANRMPMTKVEIKVIEVFTPDQIYDLLEACKNEYNDELIYRDKAILSVLFDAGIRASELVSLSLEHVHLYKHDAHLKVYGKGNKWREVPLGNKSLRSLHNYIKRYRKADKNEQHVFLNRSGKPMTVSGLDQLFDRLGSWAHIHDVRCSPHTARHTFAVNYLKNEGDIYKLSRLMGHTSVTVTEIYLRAFKSSDARKGLSVLDNLK